MSRHRFERNGGGDEMAVASRLQRCEVGDTTGVAN
jgi:hypothetical protein